MKIPVTTLAIIILSLPVDSFAVEAKPSAATVPQAASSEEMKRHASALLSRWQSLEFIPFAQFGDDYSTLSLPESKLKDETINLSPEARSALQLEGRRFLTLLRAKSFQEFVSAIKGPANDLPPLTPQTIDMLRRSLKTVPDMVRVVDTLSELELLENFWIFQTNLGRGSTYFSALAPQDSYYSLRRLKSIGEVNAKPGEWYRLRKNAESLGVVENEALFSPGISPQEIFARDGSVIVADLRFLIKCVRRSGTERSYPIIARYFLDQRRNVWIPSHSLQLYTGQRDIRPIF